MLYRKYKKPLIISVSCVFGATVLGMALFILLRQQTPEIMSQRLDSDVTSVEESRVGLDTGYDYTYVIPELIEVVSPRYDVIDRFSEGLARVRVGDDESGLWGFVDTSGVEIIPPKYDYVWSFSYGFALVFVADREAGMGWDIGRFGFINPTGEEVIPLTFDHAWCFSDGLAVVFEGDVETRSGNWFIIDTSGENVLSLEEHYDVVGGFYEGMAQIQRGNRWGFINSLGEEVVPPSYDSVRDFSERMAAVMIGDWEIGRWGFINILGEEVVLPMYYGVTPFSEGFAAVRTGDYWGFINTSGEEVVQPMYDEVRSFTEGFAAVRIDNRWGFINTLGEEVVPPRYVRVDSFSEGMAAVLEVGTRQWGFINTSGVEVIPPFYNLVYRFNYGFAPVGVSCNTSGTIFGLINTNGELVVPLEFEANDIYSLDDGDMFAFRSSDWLWGIVRIDRR